MPAAASGTPMNSSRTESLSQIREWQAPTPEEFRNEIVPTGQPAVLRGVARNWPLVVAARAGEQQCMAMLAAHANAVEADILRADPNEQGRFHYRSDGQSLNFIRGRGNLAGLVAGLREQGGAEHPFAMV